MKKSGFTLIETLVAISALSLALAGIISLSSISIRSSLAADSQVKAFFLANEGLEYIRNKRDTNIISGLSWLDGLTGCADGCFVDVFASGYSINTCSGGVCPKLKFDSSLNRYDYAGEQETIFTRKLTITEISSYEIKVVSEISWTHANTPRSFSLEERLFDLSF